VEDQSQHSESGGTLRLELRLPATPKVLSHVRRAFGELALPPPLLDDARLLVVELVTNSIRHAGLRPDDRIRVLAEVSGRRLRVDVFDRTQATSPQTLAGAIRPAPGAQSGWGLYMVDRLATRWGRGRGRYWFELELDERGSRRS
jgi:anti-sigma regulatory factor (Ser/Thr protein kinase)